MGWRGQGHGQYRPPSPPAGCAGPDGFLGEPYRLYNLDVFEYHHKSPFGLYGAIPLLMAHREGQTVGLFW